MPELPQSRRRRLPAAELDRHVEELCRAHGIVRLDGASLRARAIRRRVRARDGRAGSTRLVRIPPVTTELRYLIALHEIGHHVGHGRSGRRLEQEEAAWRWAFTSSLVPPSDASRRRCGARLRSYVTWARLRQHRRRPPHIPPPEAPFWQLLSWLES